MSGPPNIQSRASAPSYTWGEVCLGWRLLDTPGLSVIEEVVPAGAGEVWHRHGQAHQFFYVLEGEVTMEFTDGVCTFGAGQGLGVPPGVPHRLANRSGQPVRFLVVSAPSTRGDRLDLPA